MFPATLDATESLNPRVKFSPVCVSFNSPLHSLEPVNNPGSVNLEWKKRMTEGCILDYLFDDIERTFKNAPEFYLSSFLVRKLILGESDGDKLVKQLTIKIHYHQKKSSNSYSNLLLINKKNCVFSQMIFSSLYFCFFFQNSPHSSFGTLFVLQGVLNFYQLIAKLLWLMTHGR